MPAAFEGWGNGITWGKVGWGENPCGLLGMGSETEGRLHQFYCYVAGFDTTGARISGRNRKVWAHLQPTCCPNGGSPCGSRGWLRGLGTGTKQWVRGGRLEEKLIWDPQEMGAREGQGGCHRCSAVLGENVGLDIRGERGKRRSTSSPNGFLSGMTCQN